MGGGGCGDCSGVRDGGEEDGDITFIAMVRKLRMSLPGGLVGDIVVVLAEGAIKDDLLLTYLCR